MNFAGTRNKYCQYKLREGVYHVTLPGKIFVLEIGDYGADHIVICKLTLGTIRAAKEEIETTPLRSPLELKAAFEVPANVMFTGSTSLRLNIRVALLCGNLSLRAVYFWVVHQPMDELLLGTPLLKCIVLDLDKIFMDRYKEGKNLHLSSAIAEADNNKES